ncbi:helicase [Gregarina niphandrodes]|uniref:Helicase n=1 Tax=Gregarina niphandrodes TaxID=110365 RepID=A0A023B6B3_GRENI|nr:helicase [Gregarina niphandrodes]EZG64997.1 helicase [Gregarina niphandrodes]|eukprot:XP_011134116.1 helicase [Gregarina niphandrodes]
MAAEKKGRGPFEKLGLCEDVSRVATKMGYSLPTPVQRKVIPVILSGIGDVVANARTGSGKTAAFLLPLLHRLESHSKVVGARGLVVQPTRELAMQSGLVLRKMLMKLVQTSSSELLRVCYLIGGMSMAKQFEHLSNNPDILIVTPGRLVHHMVEADYELGRVCMTIFDEADMLFEMGFESDISYITSKLTWNERQSVFLSATMPAQLVSFARGRLFNPQYVQLDSENSLPDTLALELYFIRSPDKTAALLYWLFNIMEPQTQAIVFCSTAHVVSFLGEILTRHHIKATQLCGQLTQFQRQEAMKSFTKKQSNILLTTDVAARGLDINSLHYVVHYSFPASAKLFIHRSGRTARKGQMGTCISFITKEEFPYLMDLLLFSGKKLKVENKTADSITQIASELGLHFDDENPNEIGKDQMKKDLEKVVSRSSHEGLDIGGFPDLNEYREMVATAIVEDDYVKRLMESMGGGEIMYMKHRQPASKQSLRRGAEVMQMLGGPNSIADSVHPLLTQRSNVDNSASKFITTSPGRGLPEIFGTKNDHIKTDQIKVKKEEQSAANVFRTDEIIELDKDLLRSFRPTRGKGIGVAKAVFMDMKSMMQKRQDISEAAVKGLKALESSDEEEPYRHTNQPLPSHPDANDYSHGEDVDREDVDGEDVDGEDVDGEDVDADSKLLNRRPAKPRMSRAARRKLKEGCANAHRTSSLRQRQLESISDFALQSDKRDEATVAREMGLSLNSGVVMQNEAFGIIGDDQESMKKTKKVMKWNVRKKTYETTDINRAGQKVKTDSSAKSIVESKGLYKRWAAQSDRRIQAVGEREDAHLSRTFSGRRRPEVEAEPTEVIPLRELTKNQELVRKIEQKLPLTNREQRRRKALLNRQANPIITGTTKNTSTSKNTKTKSSYNEGAGRLTRKQRAKGQRSRAQSQRVFRGMVQKQMKNRSKK